MREPRWLSNEIFYKIHDLQIYRTRGADGMRDEGALLSAVNRPRNKLLYEEEACDLAKLAAAYGFGICRNHPFVDGNKRTAFLAIYIFLRKNGQSFTASEISAVITMRKLAAGEITEDELADWIRQNSEPSGIAE